jgi:hypothetical protein
MRSRVCQSNEGSRSLRMSVLNVDFTLSADGSTADWNVPVSTQYMFYAVGTFGGGTLSLECSPDNGTTWFTVDHLPSAGRLIRYLVSGETVRITLTGATTPTISTGLRQ